MPLQFNNGTRSYSFDDSDLPNFPFGKNILLHGDFYETEYSGLYYEYIKGTYSSMSINFSFVSTNAKDNVVQFYKDNVSFTIQWNGTAYGTFVPAKDFSYKDVNPGYCSFSMELESVF